MGYTYIQSTSTYDATASSVFWEVVQNGSDAAASTGAGPILDASNNIQAFVIGSTMTMRRTTATVTSDTTVAFNATTMRFIRVRQSGANWIFETAPSPVDTWTTQRTIATTFAFTALKMELFCGGTTSGSNGIFDNVNTVVRRMATRSNSLSRAVLAGGSFS